MKPSMIAAEQAQADTIAKMQEFCTFFRLSRATTHFYLPFIHLYFETLLLSAFHDEGIYPCLCDSVCDFSLVVILTRLN